MYKTYKVENWHISRGLHGVYSPAIYTLRKNGNRLEPVVDQGILGSTIFYPGQVYHRGCLTKQVTEENGMSSSTLWSVLMSRTVEREREIYI